MKTFRFMSVAAIAVMALAGPAFATPSTHIWIPSTDIQPYKKVHFGFDQYQKVEKNDDGTWEADIVNNGITVGVLPYDKFQMEVGVDYRHIGSTEYNDDPWYFNAKLGTPEGALFKGSPAIAVGGYDFGTEGDGAFRTDNNILYGMIAKTLGKLGRVSVGYFQGNDKVLLDANGEADEKGVLLAWDRTMSEISDKLWVAVDYQGTDSAYGALNFGIAWKFAPNVGVIAAYDIYNNNDYEPTVTFQVDIDL